MKLTQGTKYDRSELKLTGWTSPDPKDSAPDVVEGYHVDYYFDSEGRYKGADEFGVEPIFESIAA